MQSSESRRTLSVGFATMASLLVSCSAPAGVWLADSTPGPAQDAACTRPPHESGLEPVDWTFFSSPGAATPPAWCESVGPVVQHRPESGPGRAVDVLPVVTWNIRVGAGDIIELVSDLRQGALTGRPESDFILLLQEAYRSGPEVPDSNAKLTTRIDMPPPSGERADVVELARRLDLHLFYVPSMPNGADSDAAPNREDRGNAILSTMPLEEHQAIELPFEAQRRVAIAATVAGVASDGTPWQLRVASGHLDTRSRVNRFLDSVGPGRTRQARALDASLRGDAVVLGADLNSWSAGFLEGAVDLLHHSFPDTAPTREATFVVGGILPRTLDHLLLRLNPESTAQTHRIDRRYGSDHYPLLGLIQMRHPSVQVSQVQSASSGG
ncbi:MAG: hypothetical protein GEU90_03160 [Gemmatimonas sp.]|nr:hypothetical protein [Gemmatimonas sp.]